MCSYYFRVLSIFLNYNSLLRSVTVLILASFFLLRNLYWTDWNREAPKIETSYMDGTNRRILVKDDLGLPNGLTFDPYSSMLCWVDAGKEVLKSFFIRVVE